MRGRTRAGWPSAAGSALSPKTKIRIVCSFSDSRHPDVTRRCRGGRHSKVDMAGEILDARLQHEGADGPPSRRCGPWECIKGPFWRLCADVGRRSAPGLRKTITVTTFYSSSNVILPGNTRTRQFAGAGEAQLAQAVGQSRDARC